jgi:uncharacterized protein GlcG (DUF336 family)
MNIVRLHGILQRCEYKLDRHGRHVVQDHNPAIPADLAFTWRERVVWAEHLGPVPLPLPATYAAAEFDIGGSMTTLKTLFGAGIIALMAVVPARAQTAPPPYGPSIGIEGARRVMIAAEEVAAKNNWPVVIAIIDTGGHIVMLHRRDDVQLSAIEIAQGKARTALMFKRPSKVLDEAISSGGAGLRFLALKDIVPLEGGLPIVFQGRIIGAIGVSGVLSAQDAQIAQAGLDAIK